MQHRSEQQLLDRLLGPATMNTGRAPPGAVGWAANSRKPKDNTDLLLAAQRIKARPSSSGQASLAPRGCPPARTAWGIPCALAAMSLLTMLVLGELWPSLLLSPARASLPCAAWA